MSKLPDIPIIINGVSINVSEIAQWQIQYAKLWSDASRNMSGDIVANYIGIFPNVNVTVTVTDLNRAKQLLAAINTSYFNATFFDSHTNSMKTAQFYAADTTLNAVDVCRMGEFQIQLVPTSKASWI